eukprot:15484175-Alexandrium_andersonii.AAC.1
MRPLAAAQSHHAHAYAQHCFHPLDPPQAHQSPRCTPHQASQDCPVLPVSERGPKRVPPRWEGMERQLL